MAVERTKALAHRSRHFLGGLRPRFRIGLYNVGYRLGGALDGYPLPPARLVNLVIGTRELAWYQLGGLFMHQALVVLLRRHGKPPESWASILDFGCGCGRIVRWWAALRDLCEIWGCDYNPALIGWCQKHLSTFAKFCVNGDFPPLAFADNHFEIIYSYSVFTHLSVESQRPWMKELARVLKPGGFLLLTVHGKRAAWRAGFSADLLKRLENEGVLSFGEERSGSNDCAVYHSETYMLGQQSLGLEVVDFLPGGVRDSSEQDIYLYRKMSNATVATTQGARPAQHPAKP